MLLQTKWFERSQTARAKVGKFEPLDLSEIRRDFSIPPRVTVPDVREVQSHVSQGHNRCRHVIYLLDRHGNEIIFRVSVLCVLYTPDSNQHRALVSISSPLHFSVSILRDRCLHQIFSSSSQKLTRTRTSPITPILWALSAAWFSACGFHQGPTNSNVVAPGRFRTSPPVRKVRIGTLRAPRGSLS